MSPSELREPFLTTYKQAARLRANVGADALLVMLTGPTNWKQLKKLGRHNQIVVVGADERELEGAEEAGLLPLMLAAQGLPINERLQQALLAAVASEILESSAELVAVYSAFDPDSIDTVTLDERLGRLTARDLKKLETSVPLKTLRAVVDLAVEIGREGREGKPVGTLFVVGDHRRVLEECHPGGFDPVKGYGRKERNLLEGRVRDAIKEVAQLDGAFVIAADGTIERACQIIQTTADNITLSKGLGSRHWAAASISRATRAISVCVSESNGTVRIFQNGEVVLRIEPMRRAMKWQELEFEPPIGQES